MRAAQAVPLNDVTVDIPTYNRSEELGRAMHSLSQRRDTNFEVIVCDDGSTLDTGLACAPFGGQLRLRCLPPSGGRARPRNAGAEASSTRWISLLDSDDWWLPQRMARVEASLGEDCDLVYQALRVERHDQNTHAKPAHGAVLGEALRPVDPLLRMLRHGNPMPNSGTAVRRVLLLTMGGFEHARVEDLDAWLRLAARGARLKLIPEVLGCYWVVDKQISTFNLRQHELQHKTFLRQLDLLPPRYKAEVSSQFNYLLGSYALGLGLPSAKWHFGQVSLAVTLLRWLLTQCMAPSTHAHRGREADAMRNGVRVRSFPISGSLAKGMKRLLKDDQEYSRSGEFDVVMIKAARQSTFDAAVEVPDPMRALKVSMPCGFSALNKPAYGAYYQAVPDWLKCFDGLIFYARDYRDMDFARRQGITGLHCLCNGVDEREFASRRQQDLRQKVGMQAEHDLVRSVGSQLAGKGHWELLRVLSKARLSRRRMLVINGKAPGTGGLNLLKRQLRHALSGCWPLARQARWHRLLGPHKRVLPTDLPRADLLSLYKSADLFVLASHVECSQPVLFEAAAGVTSFVASTALYSLEIARWLGVGHIVQPGSPNSAAVSAQAISLELVACLADRARLTREGLVARDAIFAKGFTWASITQPYLAVRLPDWKDKAQAGSKT